MRFITDVNLLVDGGVSASNAERSSIDLTMPFYGDHIYPYLISRLGNPEPIRKVRERIVPLAQGIVLEIGVGPGVNFDFSAKICFGMSKRGMSARHCCRAVKMFPTLKRTNETLQSNQSL